MIDHPSTPIGNRKRYNAQHVFDSVCIDGKTFFLFSNIERFAHRKAAQTKVFNKMIRNNVQMLFGMTVKCAMTFLRWPICYVVLVFIMKSVRSRTFFRIFRNHSSNFATSRNERPWKLIVCNFELMCSISSSRTTRPSGRKCDAIIMHH